MYLVYGGIPYAQPPFVDAAPLDLNGSGSLTLTAAPAFTGTANLSGSGTLTAAGTPAVAQTATLTGSGSLSLTGTPALSRTGNFSGTGTLTLTASPAFTGSATLSGSGTLTTAGTPAFAVSRSLSGSGTLTTVGSAPAVAQTASLSGSGSLTFTTTLAVAGSTTLTGSGTLSLTATTSVAQTANLTGSGTLSLAANPAVAQTATLTGSGTLSPLATAMSASAAATLTGSGTLLPVATAMSASASAALTGSGTLSLAGTPALSRTGNFSGSGTLTLTASPAFAGSATLSGSGTLTGSGTPAFARPLALSGSGSLTFTTSLSVAQTATLTGSGTLSPLATAMSASATATLTSSGSLTLATSPAFARPLALSGSGSLTTTGAPAFAVADSLSGSGTLTLTATAAFTGTASLSGSGTLIGGASPAFAVSRSLSGSGTLTLTATAAFTQPLALSGSGTLTTVGSAPAFAVPLALTGSGSLSFTTIVRVSGNVTLSGPGTLSLIGGPQYYATGAFTGSGSLSTISAGFTILQTAYFGGAGNLTATGIVYETPTEFVPLPGTATIVPTRALRWRYVFADLLTDATIDEYELSDVRFDQRINQPGALSATYSIPNAAAAAKGRQILEGRTVCYVYRGLEVFAGPYLIWSLNIASDARGATTMAIQGAGLESYFNRREIRTDLSFTQVDQFAIARALITTPQADPGGNVLVQVDNTLSGVLRDRTEWTAESNSIYGQRLSELAAVEDGFEFRILSYIEPGTGERVRRFVTGYPQLGRPENEHVFTYPGRVVSWSISRDATQGATSFRARGDTPLSEDITTPAEPLMSDVHDRTDLLTTGWPRVDRTDDYSSVITKDVLDAHAQDNADTFGGSAAVTTATVRLSPDGSGDFTPNDLGSTARLVIQDDYMGLLNQVWRVVGMDVRPAGRTGEDTAELIFEAAGV